MHAYTALFALACIFGDVNGIRVYRYSYIEMFDFVLLSSNTLKCSLISLLMHRSVFVLQLPSMTERGVCGRENSCALVQNTA